MPIPFIDLQRQYRENREAIDRHIRDVLDSSHYVLGKKGEQLEKELAALAGVRHAVAVGNGTDALMLPLMALGIGPGDEVITTPFTFIATAEVISLLGARPVFVDIEPDTYNMDPSQIAAAVTERTRAVMPVDLFGQCADYGRIGEVARARKLAVIEDAAQSFGATQGGRAAGSFGDVAGTSFYPAKPLGCYGEGGMVFTDSDPIAEAVRSLRVHGQGAERYEHVRIGLNARLDEIQAAVLLGKLPAFPAEIQRRQEIAARYTEALRGVAATPIIRAGNTSVWAQYCIRVPNREAVRAKLQEAGVPTAVFYPIPLHLQKAFASLGYAAGDFPVSEAVAQDILALPMHPYLDGPTREFIIAQLLKSLRS